MANEVKVSVKADGVRETQRALEGLRKDAAKAGEDARRASDTARARPTTENTALSAEARALATRKSAIANFEAWRRGEEARTAREREHHLREGVSQERQASRSRMQAIQEFGTRALAVYQSLSARASALSGAFGGRSREGMLTENMNLQMSMTRFANDAGVSRSAVARSVTSAARASGLDPGQVLAGLSAAGDAAGDQHAATLLANAPLISRVAQALGSSPESVGTNVGQALALGMDPQGIEGFLNQYAAIATTSRIDPSAFGEKLGNAFGEYGAATGQTGAEAVTGAMRFQALVAASTAGNERAAAGADQMMGMLADTGFQRRLRNATGTTGTFENRIGANLNDPLETLQTIAGSGDIVLREQFEALAGGADQGLALKAIVDALRSGTGATTDVLGANAEGGAEFIQRSMSGFESIAGFGNQANQMANFMENGQQFATYADQMADGIDDLNSKFPMAVEGIDNLSDAMEKMITLLGLGGFGAGAAGVGGVAAGVGGAGIGGGAAVGAGGVGTAAGIGGMAALGIAAVGVAAVGGMYLTKEEQERAAAERRANMTTAEGEFQDFSQGDLGAADLLGRAVARRQEGRAETGAMLSGASPDADLSGRARPLDLPAFRTGAASPPTPAAANSQGGRPLIVSLDPASSNSLSNSIAARMAEETRRGESER